MKGSYNSSLDTFTTLHFIAHQQQSVGASMSIANMPSYCQTFNGLEETISPVFFVN